jgi:transposase-like protein
MDQRLQLIADLLRGDYTKSELCRMYEISRPTTDKWIARYSARGIKCMAQCFQHHVLGESGIALLNIPQSIYHATMMFDGTLGVPGRS